MKKLILLLMVFLSTQVFGQEVSETIVTAQPGFYIGPYTLEAGNLQIETQSSLFGAGNLQDWSLFSTLLRYGIDDRFEVRVSWGGLNLFKGIGGNVEAAGNIRPGLKVRLWRGKEGKYPGSALRFTVGLPNVGSTLLAPTQPSPEFLWVTRIPLWDRGSLFVNAGMIWAGPSLDPTYQGAVSFDFSPVNRLSVYTELHTYFRDLEGNGELNAGAGVYYLFANNLQGDLSFENGFRQNGRRALLLGLSYRWLRARYR